MHCVSLLRVIVFACLVIVASASDSASATIYVATTGSDTSGSGSATAPYASIQKAIDSAADGDKVVVAPGTYEGPGNRNINLQGKRITVTSSGDELNTILDLGGSRGFIAASTENEDTVISNLTISNGYAETREDWGGTGIIDITTPAGLTIRNCIFKNNEVKATYVTSNAQVINKQEHPENLGAVVSVENCLFYDNKVYGGAWMGWSFSRVVGISGAGDSTLKPGINVRSCTIYGNTLTSYNDSGGMVLHLGRGVVENSIIFNNSPATNGRSAYATATSYSVADIFIYSTFTEDVLEGYLNVDPGFVDPASGNFRLLGTSQALNAGDPSLPLDPDGSRADIGYKFPDTRTAQDTDNDGVNDYREYKDGTDPNDPNSFNPLSRGLVAYYPFDGNPNDESGNGDHGTIVGSPTLTWDRFGRSNSAYRFDDGSDNITTTGAFLPRSSEPRTLSAWVRTDVVPASPIIRIPLAWGANVDNQAFGLIMGPSMPVVWGVQFWGGGQDVMTDVVVEEGWRHVVATYDGEVIDFFLNGERYLTQNKSTTTGPGGLSIGAGIESFLGSLETAFNGAVDDVRIYNRYFSESEVKQLYFHEAFDGLQRQFIETNPSAFGLFNLTQYNASRKNGQTDVTTNPAAFKLFTRSQYNASFGAGRSAGRADVRNKPSAYGLVARSSIPSVRVATKHGNKVSVSLPGSWTRYAQSGAPRGWRFDAKKGVLSGEMPRRGRPIVRLIPYRGREAGTPITIQFQPTAR